MAMLHLIRSAVRFGFMAMAFLFPPGALPMATLIMGLSISSQAEASNTRKLLQRAHAGDTSAMRIMARTLWDGTSPKGRDRRLAVAWWKKAADDYGDDRSMVILAELYEKGKYFAQSREKAKQYYEQAAEKDNKKAQNKLFIFKKEDALSSGDADDLCEIARCYEEGDGTKKNPKAAEKWYARAAEKGSHQAQSWLFAQVREKALGGDTLAMLELAEMYEKGKYTSVSRDSALEWYKKAAEQGGFREAKEAVERLEKQDALPEQARPSARETRRCELVATRYDGDDDDF